MAADSLPGLWWDVAKIPPPSRKSPPQEYVVIRSPRTATAKDNPFGSNGFVCFVGGEYRIYPSEVQGEAAMRFENVRLRELEKEVARLKADALAASNAWGEKVARLEQAEAERTPMPEPEPEPDRPDLIAALARGYGWDRGWLRV